LDANNIHKVVKWWAINQGITSPATISNTYFVLRTFCTYFTIAESNAAKKISLNLCNEELKKEENRWYDLSNKVARENSRESVRREKNKWLDVEEIQSLTKKCFIRGTQLVNKSRKNKKLSMEECKEFQQLLWVLISNTTACQRPEILFKMSDENCVLLKDGHYRWKPFIEKNTFTTELRTLDLPTDLTGWLDFQRNKVRPRIHSLTRVKKTSNVFWLTTKGAAMSKGTGSKWFKDYISSITGRTINFRDYRWATCAWENSLPHSPEEHERFLYLSDHTQNTVNVSYKVIRDVPKETGRYEPLSFNKQITGMESFALE
jgi:hypothetical protein